MPKDTSKASNSSEDKKNKSGKLYSEEDIKYIKSNYKTTPVEEMAAHLGRTEGALRDKVARLGISLPRSNNKNYHLWTDDEISYLKKSHKKMTDADMAAHLGIHRLSVLRQRKKLGLAACKHKEYDRNGYKQLDVNGKKVWAHRYVVAKSIGRPLFKKERVHHIDLDKHNNDIENLYLCKNEKEHAVLHWDLNRVASDLVKKKLIIFDKKKGEYLLSDLLVELNKRV